MTLLVAPYKFSAGDRRAIRTALANVRCPECRDLSLGIQDLSHMSILCRHCGAYYRPDVKIRTAATRSGRRYFVTILPSSQFATRSLVERVDS